MIRCNDHYLLYLISLHDDSALEMLYAKYRPLVLSRVTALSLKDDDEREDYRQEGDIMFYTAVSAYDPSQMKTFTRYFEMILRRRFQRLRKRDLLRGSLFICLPEEMIVAEEDENYEVLVNRPALSRLEDRIYELHFVLGMKPCAVAERMSLDRKTVYNAIQRIARKARRPEARGIARE